MCDAVLVGQAWQLRPEREIEEVHLHQRRRVAEELDVALHQRLEQAQAAALQPGADDADEDAEHDAHDRELHRRPHAANEARTLEAVVEMNEVDAVGVMQAAQAFPEGVHAVARVRAVAIRYDDGERRCARHGSRLGG